jgi:hypothetical protein
LRWVENAPSAGRFLRRGPPRGNAAPGLALCPQWVRKRERMRIVFACTLVASCQAEAGLRPRPAARQRAAPVPAPATGRRRWRRAWDTVAGRRHADAHAAHQQHALANQR